MSMRQRIFPDPRHDSPAVLPRTMTMYNDSCKSYSVDDDVRLVRASLGRVSAYSNVAAAEVLQVSEATVRRWRAGSIAVPLRTVTRLALIDFVGTDPPASAGWGPEAAGGAKGETGEEAGLDLFGSVSRVSDYLRRLGPPGENATRKMDALEGIRRTITTLSPLPEWWYRLREAIESERL